VIRLCITADDYGLSRDVNESVHALVARGAVSAVSVMVHPEAELAGVAQLRGRVATGLHLVLVGERPLLPAALAPLLDAAGFLPMRYWGLFLRLAQHPRCLGPLADEIAAQIARYRTLDLPLHFINSHQHTHLLPPIWYLVARALEASGYAPAIRTADRAAIGGLHQAVLAASSRLAWKIRPLPAGIRLESMGIGFVGRSTLRDIGPALQRLERASAGRDGVIHELIMHPALEADRAAPRHLAWGIQWRREHDLLLSPEFCDLLSHYGASMMPADAITTCLGSP
jgi:predicted glycoside hydrolase/deacetylase ChbG (UPF0249 family)